ncbi:hypothetical protein OEZ71_04845 [Defluviimonas sp. WL0050]|uniref:Ferrochelatase n=1 Tax=Albidovulum litorale TaxID=2984134 RepID=A0ABT2ZKH1_9RHOB|nr:hypothetical protein [Defluviimonas sp. WL0050]MCV2871617.1 hypothetical protein [Defluviimonas sp. WL0050]
MKKVMTIAVVLGLSAGTAFAGGMSDPMVEGEPIVAGPAGSGNGALIGGLLLLGIAAAAASSSSGT